MTRTRYIIDRTELTIALRHAAQGPWRLPANDQHGPMCSCWQCENPFRPGAA